MAGTVGVIIGGGEGADITEAEVLAGDPFVERSAPVIAVGAVVAGKGSILAQLASRLGESGRRRFDRDRAAQAVSTQD